MTTQTGTEEMERMMPYRTDTGSNTLDWTDLDRDHVWHPYTQAATAPAPLPIERGEGAWLHTPDGRRVFDAISSWWVTLHGHAHPRVVGAIAEQAGQLEQVIFAGCTHEPAARLAAELADILPGDLSRIFYSDNGSTAVEVARKMCVQLWDNRGEKRSRFLALDGAYHGDTFGSMSVSARSVFTGSFEPLLFTVGRLPFPESPIEEERMLEECRAELATGRIAGLIVEPLLLGAGGMRMWRPDALRRLAELCREQGTPLIADEVLTGFGRTGTMFAVEQADVSPDIICLSKGLSGGFLPFAVTACREAIYREFLHEEKSRALLHGHSFTANPLGCAAARASLAIFRDEPVFERIAAIERTHHERIEELAVRPGIASPRVLGTVAAVDIEAEDPGYLSRATGQLAADAVEAGILLRPLGNTLYLLPPLCTTAHELHTIYDFLCSYYHV